jgi:uncharacterized membrane protein
MRIEIREKPYDLYAVITASTALLLVLLLVPDLTVLRVILGLPFILFFPGYVLISALYPEKQKIIGEEMRSGESKPEKGMTKARKREERRKRSRLRRMKEAEEKGDEEPVRETKGLDGLERLALSLGLSIAITPLIGLILNYTYDWDPEHLGIRLIPIFVSQYAFILITALIAIHRRNTVPIDDRFSIVLDISIPEDYTPADKFLTVGIAIMMILSVGMLIYIIVVPREGESFTEFYVLGSGHMADDYPGNFPAGEIQNIYLGIGNHEHRVMNYSVFMSISDNSDNKTVGSFDNVTVSTLVRPWMEISVRDGETMEIPCNFSITQIGSYKLRLLLYHDGKEYRDLHLWVKVFDPGSIETVPGRGIQVYVADPDGDPAGFLTYEQGGLLGLSVTVEQDEKDDFTMGVRIYRQGSEKSEIRDLHFIGYSESAGPGDLWTGNLSSNDVLRALFNVNSTNDLNVIILDPGGVEGELMIETEGSGWESVISVDIRGSGNG